MKLLIPILAGAILLAGCEQDPLGNASDAVRNGNLPDQGKMEPQKPLPNDSLQVDAPPKYNGRVNFPIEIKLSGRVLVPDIPFTLFVANLDKFPGATFDQVTGIFRWTPTKDFLQGQLAVMQNLEVVMKTLPGPKNYPESTENKIVPILISNAYDRPIINTVNLSQVTLGKRTEVPFEMEDQDALNEKDVSLILTDCALPTNDNDPFPSLGTFVQVDKKSIKSGVKAGQYTGNLVVDLSKVEYLQTSFSYCVAVQAISKFGVASMPYEKTLRLEGLARESKVTNSTIEMAVAEKMKLTFSFYEPTGTTILRVLSTGEIEKILPGSKIECGGPAYSVNCTALIDTTTAVAQDYKVDIKVKSTRGNNDLEKIHTLTIKVK